MRKFAAGVLVGFVLATTVAVGAVQQVKLFVDGREISFLEAPPQIINDRTMVPARPLAEALGALVEWDNETRSVVVSTKVATAIDPEKEWEFLRTIAIAHKWKAGGSPFTVDNGTKRLVFESTEVGYITGTTNEGCLVRGKVLSPGSLVVNQIDLRYCGFIP